MVHNPLTEFQNAGCSAGLVFSQEMGQKGAIHEKA